MRICGKGEENLDLYRILKDFKVGMHIFGSMVTNLRKCLELLVQATLFYTFDQQTSIFYTFLYTLNLLPLTAYIPKFFLSHFLQHF